MNGEPVTNVLLRVPKSLHDRIKALAKTSKQSISEEYIILVKAALVEEVKEKDLVQSAEVKEPSA